MGSGELSPSTAVRALFGSNLSPGTRWIATCLVYRCDKSTGATSHPLYPASLAWLASVSGFSQRVVIRHLRILMRDGFVTRSVRFAADKGQTTNVYTLDLARFGVLRVVKSGASARLAHEAAKTAELAPSSAIASRELLAKLATRRA